MRTGTILLALQEEKPAEKKTGEGPPEWMAWAPFILIAVLFYLLFIVPTRRERQRQQQLLNGLKKNDEVVTSAGILGVVTSIKDTGDEVTIRSDETRLRVLKSSIVRIINPKPDASTTSAPDQSSIVDLAKKGKA